MVRQGGIVVLPTHGLYGLGGDALNPAVIQRIFQIKRRPAANALLVLIADMQALEQVALAPDASVLHLMHRFWPGRVTFVLPARSELPPALTGGSGKVGVRLVAHPVAVALVRAVGTPLTGTSANISGAGGCAEVDQIDASVLNGVDGVLDGGPLAGGPGSTVVDATGSAPVILREGAVPGQEIWDCFKGVPPPLIQY
jgi:L-threonylcarbamoyladenylate synthase